MKNLILFLLISTLVGTGCTSDIEVKNPQQVVQAMIKDVSALDIHFEVPEPHQTLWWVTSDRKNILVEEAISTQAMLSEPAIDLSGKRQYGPSAIKLRKRVAELMRKLGFTRYGKSSSIDMTDDSYYDYIEAFQKDDIVCEFIINGDSYETTNVSFGCSDQLQESTERQLPYLEAIPDSDEAVIADIGKTSGDFVLVSVGFRREGYGAILKKVDGKYVLITSGQEAPSCDVAEKNAIPKDLVPTCYTVDGKERKR